MASTPLNFKSLLILNRPESRGVELRLRLFCFPHAGGAPDVFSYHFAKKFPSNVQVIGITYPGRGSRFGEEPMEDIKKVVSTTLDEISSVFEMPHYLPYIVYGHSFGACCALEFVRQIRRRGLTQPMRLICSGRNPPQLGVIDSPVCRLPDDELQQQMLERYGSPIMTDEEMKKLFIPPLRADLIALDDYVPDPYTENDPPLNMPLTLLVGELDHMMKTEKLNLWKEHTRKTFELRKVEGAGHFFYKDNGFLTWLKKELEDALDDVDERDELTRPHPEVLPGSGVPSRSSTSETSIGQSKAGTKSGAPLRKFGSFSPSPSSATSTPPAAKKTIPVIEEAYDLC